MNERVQSTLYTTNPTRSGLKLNPVLRGERPATTALAMAPAINKHRKTLLEIRQPYVQVL